MQSKEVPVNLHHHKWNHNTYTCKCNNLNQFGQENYQVSPVKSRRQKKIDIYHQKKSLSSNGSGGDCSCEMLDTSLSNISDLDCECSECQEAKLQAFNEIALQEKNLLKQNYDNNNRGLSTRVVSGKKTRGISKKTIKNEQNRNDKLARYKSVGKLRQNKQHASVQRQQFKKETQKDNDYDDNFPKFSQESVNDYIAITQHRARQYLRQLKGTKKNQQLQKQRMQQKIRQKLYILKTYNLHQRKKDDLSQKQEIKPVNLHQHKWNHKPYSCKCNNPNQFREEPLNGANINQQNQKNVQEQNKATVEKMNEKIRKYKEKIKERIIKYKEKNKQIPYQCPDKCPHHHLRTSKTKIKQIQKFILKKAKQIEEKEKKKKIQEEEKEKIREAKLRAIDIRSKQLLAKSKKYNPEQERTSFHNSIDHFSTFSQLRQNKQEKDNQKKQEKQMKAAIKKGGLSENAIYEDIQDLIGQHPQIQSKIVKNPYQSTPQKQQWCQKIVKQARLRPPKQIKQQDKSHKNKKKQQKQPQAKKQSHSDKMTKDIKKQDKKRKQLQDEIERKKQQIIKQFQKRNSNNFSDKNKKDPKNKALRQQYQQKLKQKETQFQPKKNSGKKQYDPYRQVYKHQPTNNPKQMSIVGDPLMQQYEYQRNSKRAQQEANKFDHDIFSNSGGVLLNKKKLKV